jgi:hypothetical protein
MTDWDSDYFNTKYTVCFTNRITHQTFSSEYHDIYGSRAPKRISALASYFRWSPSEEFVVFPEEDWPKAPGAPQHIILNLDPSFPWKDALVRMELTLWIDSLTVIGDAHDDCDYSVVIFNGRTGKTIPLTDDSSRIGYSLVGLKNEQVFIKTLLDNCRSPEDESHFTPGVDSISLFQIRTDYLHLAK